MKPYCTLNERDSNQQFNLSNGPLLRVNLFLSNHIYQIDI